MGWASYVEDIFSRYTLEFNGVMEELESYKDPTPKQLERLFERLKMISEQFARDRGKLLNIIDLASDPEVDVAYQLVFTEEEQGKLMSRVRELEGKLDRLSARNIHLRQELANSQERCEALEKENRAFASKNIEKAYDMHFTREQLERDKPEG